MGNYLSFLCSSLLASYAKNKNVFSFKYYFAGNYLLKVNNKDIKIIFMDVVQVSFLLTLSRYVVMWQIFFTLYATWIHAPKLNLTKKTWVQICFKPLYKKWNFPLKISSVNGKLHFCVQCYKAMSKLFLLLIHFRSMLLFVNTIKTLREKCPNTEFFLVRIFPYSVRIRENTDHKKLRIWTIFT